MDTTGQLRDQDGSLLCLILEDRVRSGPKVYGQTAIPEGKYRITMHQSPRFGRELPILNGVPGFSGVLIHPGNDRGDTEGCLLPGLSRRTLEDGSQFVAHSRDAFNLIMPIIRKTIEGGDSLWIKIVNQTQE